MNERQGRPRVGFILLAGLMLFGAGCFTIVIALGGAAGMLRDDPQGTAMLGIVAMLIGVALIALAVSRRR